MCIRPQSEILILVDSWPPTPKIWWPNSNFSGQRKEKLVAKIHGKKVKTNLCKTKKPLKSTVRTKSIKE
jgi:hypothetical protein